MASVLKRKAVSGAVVLCFICFALMPMGCATHEKQVDSLKWKNDANSIYKQQNENKEGSVTVDSMEPIKEADKEFISTDYQIVYKAGEIPKNVRNALFEKLNGEKIAETNEQFNAGCVIRDPKVPRRRLVFAGNSNNSCFVCYEHGGIGLHCHLIIFSVDKEKVQITFNGSYFYKPENIKQLKQWVNENKFDSASDW